MFDYWKPDWQPLSHLLCGQVTAVQPIRMEGTLEIKLKQAGNKVRNFSLIFVSSDRTEMTVSQFVYF